MTVNIHFSTEKRQYTGSELCSHFAYRNFDVFGNSCVAFLGMCWVEKEALVDLADRKAEATIFSRLMLHFIVEDFEDDLNTAIWRQRVLTAIVQQELMRFGVAGVQRQGDDLYVGRAKLTVSIATSTPVSTMIHFGINVSSKDTPVETLGLEDFEVDPRPFGLAVLESYQKECAGVRQARCKVRAVP